MRIIFCFFICLLVNISSAQEFVYEKNETALKQLLEEEIQSQKLRKERVKDYLMSHPDHESTFQMNGKDYFIRDIVNGTPKFYVTHNAGSALSLGVGDVRAGGSFGLNLTGENTRIAIWDSGISKNTHVEFEGRLTNNDSGTDFSDHSTHVMGTILAGGINPNARGFCYNATAQAFDWFDDTIEMINEVMSRDILVSNHSYGVPGGWEGGAWKGDPAISSQEDYRFGFYDNDARSFDQISYNSPYYTIVNSAGNERGESGNGTFPPDGPFDCISGFATAKNVITVGAVNKIPTGYTTPTDVVMSSFSSWGPVDDGRIKPDFVAPGVSLFSSVSGNDNTSYANFSGTSMASPSAAGGVALINEAYHLFNSGFMKSSSMKALIIHTINEAGNADGPDYIFGWGLMSVSNSVDHIIKTDGVDNHMIESTLGNEGSFELELNPLPGKKITATLVWNDVAGNPVAASLDPGDLMLVNDLDMVLVDEIGNEVLPWTLDPATPGLAAKKGDNFRDNVEKIEFDSPEPRKYFLRITHENTLENGNQDFSLIISYSSEGEGVENLYWVDDDGQWTDGMKWSLNSGGSSSGVTPQSNNKIIFDDNSFSGQDGTVIMNSDFEVAGVVALNNKNITFDLGGNTLKISGTTLLSSPNFTIQNGTLMFENDNADLEKSIDLNGSVLNDVNIIFGMNNAAEWSITDNEVTVQNIELNSGSLVLDNSMIYADGFIAAPVVDAKIALMDAVLGINSPLSINANTRITERGMNSIQIAGASQAEVDLQLENLKTPISIENSQVSLSASTVISTINSSSSDLMLLSDVSINSLSILDSGSLTFNDNHTLNLIELNIQADENERISITGSDTGFNSSLGIEGRKKFCFDYLDISNTDLIGESVVSIGENSTLSNSNNWFLGACQNLLFSDFVSEYLCVDGISFFTDVSEGNVQSRTWFVDGIEQSNDEVLEYQFETPGNHTVLLIVSDGNGNENRYEVDITVNSSSIEDNSIVTNSTQLVSLKVAESYQWYKNYEKLEGETDRIYLYQGEVGIYWVLTFEGGCNKISEILDLGVGTSEELIEDLNNKIEIKPNPFNSELDINIDYNSNNGTLTIVNILGKELLTINNLQNENHLQLGHLPNGTYILIIQLDELRLTKKIIKTNE